MIKKPELQGMMGKCVSPFWYLFFMWISISHSFLMWYVIYKEFPEHHHALTSILLLGIQASQVMLSMYLLHLLFYAVLYATKRKLYKNQIKRSAKNWEA